MVAAGADPGRATRSSSTRGRSCRRDRDNQHMKQAPACHKGEGMRGSAEDTAAPAKEGQGIDPGKQLGKQRLGLHRLPRMASTPPVALAAHGTRPERTRVARPGPVRPAAVAADENDVGQEMKQAPQRLGLHRLPRRASAPT